MIQQCSEITTEALHTSFNMELDHNTNMIAIINLYMLTIMRPGSPNHWEGIHRFKPVALFKSHFVGCSGFFTLGLAETYIHFSHAGLAQSGRYSQLFLINSEKDIYTIR